MVETETRRRPGGRSARVRANVIDAAQALLRDAGPDGFSIAAVSTRSGVHETSIYRRWGGPQRLMIDALLSYSEQHLPIPDTGALRGDLIDFATELMDYLSSPLGRALAQALVIGTDDLAVREAREEFWQARYARTKIMIERGVARGELPDTVDAELAVQLLIAPLHFRALLTHQPITADFLPGLIDAVLDGLRARDG